MQYFLLLKIYLKFDEIFSSSFLLIFNISGLNQALRIVYLTYNELFFVILLIIKNNFNIL